MQGYIQGTEEVTKATIGEVAQALRDWEQATIGLVNTIYPIMNRGTAWKWEPLTSFEGLFTVNIRDLQGLHLNAVTVLGRMAAEQFAE